MNHPLRCRCGTLQGYVSHPEEGSRGVCYCKDCQAYAHFLGKTGDILDEMGGTDVVAILPKYVTFTQGFEALACLSLTENGLLRWYAGCCNTPIGNTPRNFKVSYVGLVHTCLEDPSKTLEGSFGPVRMRNSTKNATGGGPKSMPIGKLAAMLRFSSSLIRARLDGSYRSTPFFAPDRGTPVIPPKVLTGAERDRVMNAAGTIHQQLSIDAPAARVYEALSSADQIGTWWDKQTAVQTDRGLVLEHDPGPGHGVVRLRVVELIPNRRVQWACISVHPRSSPASAWTGTHFIFELAERTGSTTLDFRQVGYDERSGYFESNKTAWREVLQNLKQVVESPRS